MFDKVTTITGEQQFLSNSNYVRYPQLIAVQASNVTPRLTQFVDAKVHEHMLLDSSFITLDGAVKLSPSNSAMTYMCNLDTFLLSELREAIVNNICYNVVVRLKNREIDTLIHSTQNVDLFSTVFSVGYRVNQERLKDVLLNNDNPTPFDYADCNPASMWTNSELLADYIDNFNTRVLREIYSMLNYIVKTSRNILVSYIVELTDQLYDQVMRLFDEQKINLNIRPISVFVSTISYDLILLN